MVRNKLVSICIQAKNQAGKWIDATPIPGTLVCNIGDMLKASVCTAFYLQVWMFKIWSRHSDNWGRSQTRCSSHRFASSLQCSALFLFSVQRRIKRWSKSSLAYLELKTKGESKFTIFLLPKSLILEIATTLQIHLQVFTNGLYTPTVHRVVNADPTVSRISIPFFYECAFEAQVAPIPQLLSSKQAASHSPIRYGTHLLNKVLNNFDFEEARNTVTVWASCMLCNSCMFEGLYISIFYIHREVLYNLLQAYITSPLEVYCIMRELCISCCSSFYASDFSSSIGGPSWKEFWAYSFTHSSLLGSLHMGSFTLIYTKGNSNFQTAN